MMNKTLLASALAFALSGTAHAATNTNDGSPNSADGANSTAVSPGTGTRGTPVNNTNDGTPTTKDGRKADFSDRSVGSDGKPVRGTNDGSRDNMTKHRDYTKSTEYSAYRTKAQYSARASDVVGADVVNASHTEIGEVDDVIYSRSEKELQAVIHVGDFAGMGGKLVAVPLDELRMDGHGNVYLNTTEAELKARPSFAYYQGEPMGMDRFQVRNRGSLN